MCNTVYGCTVVGGDSKPVRDGRGTEAGPKGSGEHSDSGGGRGLGGATPQGRAASGTYTHLLPPGSDLEVRRSCASSQSCAFPSHTSSEPPFFSL